MAVKIGFIGAGGIAGHHMAQLAGVRGVDMVAFADKDKARAQSRAEEYGGRAYTKFEEMLAKEELDGVFICTPPHVHGDPEFACIERGLPMFIEKPVSNDLTLAKKILKKIRDTGLMTSVGYHWRYMEGTRKALEALADKTICMAIGSWCGGFPMVPWWRKKSQGGGQNLEQTTHIFDLLRMLCGEVKAVHALYAKRVMHKVVPGADVEDVGVTNLLLASGAVASISNCCCARNWGDVGLTVITHEVVCEIQGNGRGIITPAEKEAKVVEPPANQAARISKAFVDAIRTHDPSGILSSYEDAVRTLAVTEAAARSAHSRHLERVPSV